MVQDTNFTSVSLDPLIDFSNLNHNPSSSSLFSPSLFSLQRRKDFKISPFAIKRTTMTLIVSRMPRGSLTRLLFTTRRSLSTATSTEVTTQKKLERIANELFSLNKFERNDYKILFGLKLGLDKYGPTVSGVGGSGGSVGSGDGSAAAGSAKAEEKTMFDIKLQKFDAAAKIKIIKEVRTFTDLGLKEAKELVEKTPVVLKKGVTKDEGNPILEKLKELGATVVLE